MPEETSTTQQIPFRRRFGFFFAFRIAPGFFVGFFPGRFGFGSMSADFNYNWDNDMTIHRISEQEYMTLRRIGIPEIPVTMGMASEF